MIIEKDTFPNKPRRGVMIIEKDTFPNKPRRGVMILPMFSPLLVLACRFKTSPEIRVLSAGETNNRIDNSLLLVTLTAFAKTNNGINSLSHCSHLSKLK